METWVIPLIEFLFAAALFVNALLFIPQALQIYKQKKSEEVSLITFGGFWLTQFPQFVERSPSSVLTIILTHTMI